MKTSILITFLSAAAVAAQDSATLPPEKPAPTRVEIFRELVSGSMDEGERLLTEKLQARPRRSPVELPLGHGLAYAACRASEEELPLRAVLLVESAFTKLDSYLAGSDLSNVNRARALDIKAYVYEVVLHDHDSAYALALEASRLDPDNESVRAILDRLELRRPSARAFGLSTPHVNAGYRVAPTEAALSFADAPAGGRELVMRTPAPGAYRLETSTDLVGWTEAWRGRLEAGPVAIGLEAAGEPHRFYRLVPTEETSAK
ncbi:MAG: hypothetical protein HYY24_08545 [Verrucomicrobia bacterium]|nr:hypothetical protein [Verrucomicrobiota bacterium]